MLHRISMNVADSIKVKTKTTNKNAYATTPQRIGTWIDGTPIWRYAFSMDYSDSICMLGFFGGSYVPSDFMDIALSNFLRDWTTVHGIINSYCEVMRVDYPFGDVVPRHNESSIDGGVLFDLSKLTSAIRSILKSDIDAGDTPIINGWVEFITPESNIITETEATT